MKTIATLFLVALLPLVAQAQAIKVTAIGPVLSSNGFDSSVQSGLTPFTLTFVINAKTVATSDTGTVASYTDPGETLNLSFGDYNLTLAGSSLATIDSNLSGNYGYRLGFTTTTVADALQNFSPQINLLSRTAAVAPTTALSSIAPFPISNFSGGTNFIFTAMPVAGGNTEVAFGNVTSYSVQEVPEPLNLTLVLIAIAAVGIKYAVKRKKSQ
jgi:hypothetical protein